MGLIRVLLALSVVFAHSPWNDGLALVGGRNAVQLFYMISGFLIAHVLHTNRSYDNPLRFYANRALRIYPTYYAVAILSLIVALLGHSRWTAFYRDVGVLPGALVALSNALIFGQDWAMFGAVQDGRLTFTTDFHASTPPLYDGLLIPQAWTLGLELTFYLIAPFIVRRTRLMLGLLATSLAVRAWLFAIGLGTHDPWTYRFFPAELSLFLLGALANRLGLPLWQRIVAQPRWHQLPRIAVAVVSALVLSYFLLPIQEGIKTGGLMLVFLVLLPLTFLYQARSQLDRRLGDLSYPLYISHVLVTIVVGVILRAAHIGQNAAVVTFFNVIASLAFAALLNRILERPVEHLRSRVRRGASAPSL